MKKASKFIFSLISKGQIIFFLITSLIVISSSIALDVTQASEISTDESLDFTVVVDAGHDVK